MTDLHPYQPPAGTLKPITQLLASLMCDLCRNSVFVTGSPQNKGECRAVFFQQTRAAARENRRQSPLLWIHQLFGRVGRLVSADQMRRESGYFQATLAPAAPLSALILKGDEKVRVTSLCHHFLNFILTRVPMFCVIIPPVTVIQRVLIL